MRFAWSNRVASDGFRARSRQDKLGELLRGCGVVHFIDSKSALGCVIKGFSRQQDLALVAGRLWFEACALMLDYSAHYVASRLNIADGPSRDDVALLASLGASEITD